MSRRLSSDSDLSINIGNDNDTPLSPPYTSTPHHQNRHLFNLTLPSFSSLISSSNSAFQPFNHLRTKINFKSVESLAVSSASVDSRTSSSFRSMLQDTGYNSITADIQENHSSDKENNKSTAKNKHKKTSNKTKKVTQERTKFTDIQKWTLNQFYSNQTRYPSSLEIERLGTQLSLSEAKIRVWFQNKRVRHKPGNMQITDNNSYGITQTPPPLLPTVPFILPNLCPLPLPSSIVNLREIYGQPEFRF